MTLNQSALLQITDALRTADGGDLPLRIPKLRTGSFFPTLLEPRRRVDVALHAVVMEAYSTVSRPGRSTTSSPRWVSTPG